MSSFKMCKFYDRFNSAKFEPLLSFTSFVISFCGLMTSPVHLLSSCWSWNRMASSYYCHFYTHLFTFLSYATPLKTKEITNQQIEEALRANNCTSVEFDEVKLTSNTVNMFKILEYLTEEIWTLVLSKGIVPVKSALLTPHFYNVERNR